MSAWSLVCLICDAKPEDCDGYQRQLHGDLVALQHHAMLEHNVGHEDLERSRREPDHGDGDQANVYRWQLPDGRWWLQSTRIEEVVEPVITVRDGIEIQGR